MSQVRLAQRETVVTARAGTWITLVALLSAGWATNHFAAMLPVLADLEDIAKPGLDAAFGLYALGLLPSLLLGGGLSDRHGRRPVVVTGLVLASLGNLVMLAAPTLAGVTVGRLVVGLGVGMVASAGTAWAADQDAAKGAARAGVLLTSGFAVGPVASALITWTVPGRPGALLAFAVPAVFTAAFAVLCLRVADRGPSRVAERRAVTDGSTTTTDQRRLGPALAASLPMALWVFACVTVAMIVLTERIGAQYAGPLLPAAAAVLSLGTGVLVQVGMRRAGGWRAFGVVGAAMAMTGFVVAGVAGAQMGLATFAVCSVILGSAYGLCLGQGLRDIDRLAPLASRGVATGLFYVVSYSGFALPFVLNTYEDALGASAPMYVLAALAAITALARLRLVRRGALPSLTRGKQ